jgi:hypothetical protein
MPTDSTTPPSLQCSKCAATLPEEAQFCLKCGTPVNTPSKEITRVEFVPKLSRPRYKRRAFWWVLLAIVLGAFLWAISSDNPLAEAFQELIGSKHDQAILETPFSIPAHNFRYYKFSLPEGSTHIAIVGQFAASPKSDNARRLPDKEADSNNIEVYVLSESAFAIWQKGYGTSSVYESGRVSQGTLQADLPVGAGIYYLVFSNKFATRVDKDVNATILLRYKSWIPEWLRQWKASFWSWLGI